MDDNHEQVKRLQERFAVAHQEGEDCLERGDYDGFARAVIARIRQATDA